MSQDFFNVIQCILILVATAGILWLVQFVSKLILEYEFFKKKKAKYLAEENKLNEREKNLQNSQLNLTVRYNELESERIQIKADRVEIENLRNIFDEKQQTYPWLAEFVAEYYYLRDGKVVNYLDTKRNPAYKAAEIVSEYSRENRTLRKSLKQAEYQLAVYESVFPWLEEFKEIPPSDVVASMSQVSESEESKSEYETLKFWLSPEEYNQLSNVEKYQLALDRYEKRNKSNWEIGREYERYVGFLYEKKGYAVSYVGALMGLEDMGRDLIAKKNNKILIIQCKNWAERKTIHEKHIFQLFGSVTEYNIDNDTKAKGVFVSTCDLSKKAQAFADQLKIKCSQVEFKHDYPKIKCNISERTGEKIYHLPFDQQYDRIIIESEKGECYAGTVAEAEHKGFRRAKRYIPEST